MTPDPLAHSPASSHAVGMPVPADAVQAAAHAEITRLRDLLATIWLYIDWRAVTRRLTTEQRELFAAAVEDRDDGPPVTVDRWWSAARRHRAEIHRNLARQIEQEQTAVDLADLARWKVLAEQREREIARLRADLETARAAINDYENRITWFTTCKECASLLDRCIEADTRAEQAEAALARVRELHRRTDRDSCAHCSENDYPYYETAWPCATIAALTTPETPAEASPREETA